MTSAERTTIEKLRDELHAYHVDVQRLVQRCEACRADVCRWRRTSTGCPATKRPAPA